MRWVYLRTYASVAVLNERLVKKIHVVSRPSGTLGCGHFMPPMRKILPVRGVLAAARYRGGGGETGLLALVPLRFCCVIVQRI